MQRNLYPNSSKSVKRVSEETSQDILTTLKMSKDSTTKENNKDKELPLMPLEWLAFWLHVGKITNPAKQSHNTVWNSTHYITQSKEIKLFFGHWKRATEKKKSHNM